MRKTTLEDIGRMAVELSRLVAKRTELRRRDRGISETLRPADHDAIGQDIRRTRNTLLKASQRYAARADALSKGGKP